MKRQTMIDFPTGGGGGSFNCLRQDSTPERVWKKLFRQLFFYYSKFVKAFFSNNVFWGLSLSRILFVCHRRVGKASAFPPQKKAAFTLAEVLITLGIIGIVAAMTLPTLLANQRQKELHTRFQKAYSILWNIHMRMVGDYNGVYNNFIQFDNNSAVTDTSIKYDYIDKFKSYVNGGKFCTYTNSYTTCSGNKNTPAVYKTYDGGKNAYMSADTVLDRAVVSNDGLCFFFGSVTFRNARIYVDTNGTAKGPNRLGFDLFAFDIDKNDKIIFPKNIGGGTTGATEDGSVDTVNACSITKTANQYNGFGCSRFALTDKHPDYPNKSYWKNLPK